MLTIERKIELMQHYGLTSNEIDLAVAIFMAQDEEANPKYLMTWYKIHGHEIFKNSLIGLKNKEVILKSFIIPVEGARFSPNSVEFNKTFLKIFLKHSGQMGKELWEAYPSFMIINGRAMSLKNIIKENVGYRNLDEFFFAYGKSIKFDPEKHKEVLEITEKANKAGMLNEGILSYVGNQRWDILKHEFENGALDYGVEITFE
jgi:hypothetical protein